MVPENREVLKTTVLFVTAAESTDSSRTLTPLGELQARAFAAELVRAGRSNFDHIMIPVYEAAAWRTAEVIREVIGGPDVSFLKELAISSDTMCGDEIRQLIKRRVDQPIRAYAGDHGYLALVSHSARALREIRKFVNPLQHQKFLICSQHSHLLSCLALHWASELVYSGSKILTSHAPPASRNDVCCMANEMALAQAQGLVLSFDASSPEQRAIRPIEIITGGFL